MRISQRPYKKIEIRQLTEMPFSVFCRNNVLTETIVEYCNGILFSMEIPDIMIEDVALVNFELDVLYVEKFQYCDNTFIPEIEYQGYKSTVLESHDEVTKSIVRFIQREKKKKTIKKNIKKRKNKQ